jgi:hypothetical protein
MPKKYTIFSIENDDTVIKFEVDQAMYNAYQILTPQQKSNSGFKEITTIRTK